ncbi:MAG: transcription-repair coupling factor, partial [[Clostridium] leptum]
MKFLSTLLDGVTEYETLVSAVERHNTPAAVTGVSGIHKAHLIHSLCARTGRKALVLASDEGEGQRLCNDLSSMGTAALVYPARDFNFRAAEGQSREYEHQRLQVMAGMLDGDYQVVISC